MASSGGRAHQSTDLANAVRKWPMATRPPDPGPTDNRYLKLVRPNPGLEREQAQGAQRVADRRRTLYD